MKAEAVKNGNRSHERGTALVTAIFAILLGSLIGVALYQYTITTMRISVNNRDMTEALYLADAGLNHASTLINKTARRDYSRILTNGANSAPNTFDELSVPVSSAWSSSESIPAGDFKSGGVKFGAGRYFVSVKNDTAAGETATADKNGILILTATGVGRDGATATLEAIVRSTSVDFPGMVANGDVQFTADVKVLGPTGVIYLNGGYTIPGSHMACAEKRFLIGGPSSPRASMKTNPLCDVDPVVGSTILFNQPKQSPPIFTPAKMRAEFKPQATWVFKDNGEVYPQTNGIERTLSLSKKEMENLGLDEWDFNSNSKTWKYSDKDRLPDATYYFQNSNLDLSGGGDSSDPPRVTMFAEGSMKLSKEITLQPHLPGYSLVSGNDIQMSTRFGNIINPGLVYAWGQMKFSSVTLIYGNVIAAGYEREDGTILSDQLDPGGGNLVPSSKGVMQFSNTVTVITVDGGLTAGSKVIGWREVRY